jgi:hypothetical protein
MPEFRGYVPGQTYVCVRCERGFVHHFDASDVTPALCHICAVAIQDLWGPVSSSAQPVAAPSPDLWEVSHDA